MNHLPQPMQLFLHIFTSLLLQWPLLIHCGASELHEHISPPRPHISGYQVDVLNIFHSSNNQIKENKFWGLFAFQSSALPEKCHSVTTLFHLSTVRCYFVCLGFREFSNVCCGGGGVFGGVVFWVFVVWGFFGSCLPRSTQEPFSETCPKVL